MSRRPLPLNALRAFEAVGRHRNISRAAEELALTHAAVSRHIRNLEQTLGQALFDRTPRGVEPLPNALALLEAVSGGLAGIGEAFDALAGRPTTRLSLSCGICIGMRFILPRLERFEAEAQGVTVDVDATPRIVDIERFEADFAIRFLPETAQVGKARCESLFTSAMVPVVRPDHAVDLDGVGAEGLLDAKLLQDDDGRLWRYWFEANGVAFDDAASRTTKVTGTALSIEAATRGLGVALAPLEFIDDELRTGALAIPAGLKTVPFGAYYLVYMPETVRRKAGAAFRRWVIEEFASPAAA